MQQKKILAYCVSMLFSMALVSNAEAINLKDMLNVVGQANNSVSALQPTVPVQTGSLIELLVKKTGATGNQAQAGAGALFQIAKAKMQGDLFAKLEQSVPGMQGMLGAAPVLSQQNGLVGRLSSMAGASGGTAGTLISAASSFQQLGMSPAMVQQFVPLVISYVKNQGNDALVNSLSTALIGR